jgi:protein-tyrosine phosphatase
MLRSFDPRSGAHALDVDDPYYGDHTDFEDVFRVIDAALPGLHDWVDRSLAGEVHPAKEGHLAAERPEDECVG